MDLELIFQEYGSPLIENVPDKLIVIAEPVGEVLFAHDRIFHLLPEEGFLEEGIELMLIKLSDDEDIDDTVRFRLKILNMLRNGDQTDILPAFEESVEFLHHIIVLHEDLDNLVEENTALVQRIEFLLVFLFRFQDLQLFQIHELPPH